MADRSGWMASSRARPGVMLGEGLRWRAIRPDKGAGFGGFTEHSARPAPVGRLQEARVKGRMERQAILTREKPPMTMFVLDESVLRRPIGGAKVMVEQVDHLIGLAWSPRVQVRIMLFERTTSVALGGGFILLSFEDDTDLIYIESGGVSQLLDDRDKVFKAGMDFNTLIGEALSQAESIELMKRTRKEYL
ncbi:DUF5753 domain-containing protein [Actinoallomurus sp. NPDC052274]|uniref:DUF5753 domain-containing protein n=1 Tax=Actinoallomurus sp. NPDC052274 TaxID=3155420 RepID=UPI003424DCD5